MTQYLLEMGSIEFKRSILASMRKLSLQVDNKLPSILSEIFCRFIIVVLFPNKAKFSQVLVRVVRYLILIFIFLLNLYRISSYFP